MSRAAAAHLSYYVAGLSDCSTARTLNLAARGAAAMQPEVADWLEKLIRVQCLHELIGVRGFGTVLFDYFPGHEPCSQPLLRARQLQHVPSA